MGRLSVSLGSATRQAYVIAVSRFTPGKTRNGEDRWTLGARSAWCRLLTRGGGGVRLYCRRRRRIE